MLRLDLICTAFLSVHLSKAECYGSSYGTRRRLRGWFVGRSKPYIVLHILRFDPFIQDALMGMPSMNIKDVALAKEVLFQKVDDEVILLNLETEIYYSLDSVGARFLDAALESESIEVAVDKLEAEYDATRDCIENDMIAFISELKDKGLIVSSETD